MKKDGRYLMWYRIRSNDERGVGYGFAESEDGLNWSKYEEPPNLYSRPDAQQQRKDCGRRRRSTELDYTRRQLRHPL